MTLNEEYVSTSEMLKSLSHPARLSIAALLLQKGNINVTTIHTTLNLPQSTVSLHLSRLKSGKVVKSTRHGLEIYYELADARVRQALEALLSVPRGA